MKLNFKLVDQQKQALVMWLSKFRWLMLACFFILVAHGYLVVKDAFGFKVYLIMQTIFSLLILSIIFFKPKIYHIGDIFFSNDEITVAMNYGRITAFKLDQTKKVTVKHGSTFNKLSDEADVQFGVMNYVEIALLSGATSKFQFQIDSKVDNTLFLKLVEEWSSNFKGIEYIDMS